MNAGRLLAIVVLAAAVVATVWGIRRAIQAPGVEAGRNGQMDAEAVHFPPLPGFDLVDRSGQRIQKADLEGKVWVAGFIFTRCQGPCPRVAAQMLSLQKALFPSGVWLVTFTVDPGFDLPEVLDLYAKKLGAGPHWLFLTGEEGPLYRLIREGFKLGVGAAEEPGAAHAVTHSTRLVLVDRSGSIQGYFDSEDPGAMSRLIRKAGDLTR